MGTLTGSAAQELDVHEHIPGKITHRKVHIANSSIHVCLASPVLLPGQPCSHLLCRGLTKVFGDVGPVEGLVEVAKAA